MLRDVEMRAHLKRLKIPKVGIDYIMRVRASPPSRRVAARAFLNTPIRYASQRMRQAIQAEAYTTAGLRVLQLEYDTKNVLEYWDETQAVDVEGTRTDGRHLRTTYTPDLLVIYRDRVVAEEPRDEGKLRALCRQRPEDWIRDGERYRFLPAERAFASMGIEHRVISSQSFNALLADNLNLLIHSRRTQEQPSWNKKLKVALRLLSSETVLSISALAKALRLVDLTPIIKWIDDGIIKADIEASLLADPDSTPVALSLVALDRYQRALRQFVVDPIKATSIDGSRVPTDKYSIKAMERDQILRGEIATTASARTLRRWRAQLRAAGGALSALIPGYWNSGAQGCRIARDHRRFIARVIKRHYATEKRPSERGSYRDYLRKLEGSQRRGISRKPVAFNTFRKIRKSLKQQELDRGRGGRRAANAAASPTDPKKRALPATRPFQKAHIDHYLCKAWVVVHRSNNVIYTARPWLTLMTDEYSGRILAIALGLTHPSRVSVAAVLRDCVRRNGRLPEWIMTDQGAEFRSTYYEAALARMGVHKQERPSGAPRFGGPHERVFGTIGTEALAGMSGSMLRAERVRCISASHHGRKTAAHSLEELYGRLEAYCFGEYNQHARGEQSASPDVLCSEGLSKFDCSGIKKEYDIDFLIGTAIPGPAKKYAVDPARGVNVYGRFYRCPALQASSIDKVTQLRTEPCDDNRVYVQVRKKWVIAYYRPPASGAYTDPIRRMFESIRHLEGRKAQALAKKAREMSLARRVCKLDRTDTQKTSRTTKLATNEVAARPSRRRRTPASVKAFGFRARSVP